MLALSLDPSLGEADLTAEQGAFVEGLDLQTLVITSIFCDAPARAGDNPPADAPRAGWWADAYSDGDVWGSRMWLLSRAKLVPETARRAEEYAQEALAWMVTDQIASKVRAQASIERIDGTRDRAVYLTVDIYAPSGKRAYSGGPWEVLRGAA